MGRMPTLPAEKQRRRMMQLIGELAPNEGRYPTAVAGVELVRADRSRARAPVLFRPSICILASGRKRGYVGDRSFVYDRSHYLVLSVPLPFEVEVKLEEGEPLLGVSVGVDLSTLSELAAKLPRTAQPSPATQRCVDATPLDGPLTETVLRLLQSLRSSEEAAVLGPGIVREILYRVLSGTQSATLWALLGRDAPAAKIHAALLQMHQACEEPMDVGRWATEAGMSVSAFHRSFKAVTATSPVQYLKTVRLHKARLLLAHDKLGVATAAHRVGYESVSQFSREYRRLFGAPPLQEVGRQRASLSRNGAHAKPFAFTTRD